MHHQLTGAYLEHLVFSTGSVGALAPATLNKLGPAIFQHFSPVGKNCG